MRLLILVTNLVAYASGGALQGGITDTLKPPLPVHQETFAYTPTAGLGISSNNARPGVPRAGGWVGIQKEQQQQQQYHQQHEQHQQLQLQEQYQQHGDFSTQGLLASYQPSPVQSQDQTQVQAQVPQYENSLLTTTGVSEGHQVSLTTGANYHQQGSSASCTGHKYTSVNFGNGLVGLGPSVNYNAIGQDQGQNSYATVEQSLGQAAEDFAFGNTDLPSFGFLSAQVSSNRVPSATAENHVALGAVESASPGVYDTISVSQHIPTIPIEVPHQYQVGHTHTAVVPTPVEALQPIAIEVSQPVRVPVEQSVRVKVPHAEPITTPVKVAEPLYQKPPEFLHTDVQHHFKHQHQHQPSISEFSAQGPFKPLSQAYHRPQHLESHSPSHSFSHYNNDNQHHVASYHLGSNHHSSSILAGLTGGLSSKLRGGHGGGATYHYGGGYGAGGGFGGDHKFANGLTVSGLSLHGHAYRGEGGYKVGHGFSGALGLLGSKHLSDGDYSKKHRFPTVSYEKFPSTYSSSFPSYHSFDSNYSKGFSSTYKIPKVPETINQHYDSNGGYKY